MNSRAWLSASICGDLLALMTCDDACIFAVGNDGRLIVTSGRAQQFAVCARPDQTKNQSVARNG
jgi:hypothetical protein